MGGTAETEREKSNCITFGINQDSAEQFRQLFVSSRCISACCRYSRSQQEPVTRGGTAAAGATPSAGCVTRCGWWSAHRDNPMKSTSPSFLFLVILSFFWGSSHTNTASFSYLFISHPAGRQMLGRFPFFSLSFSFSYWSSRLKCHFSPLPRCYGGLSWGVRLLVVCRYTHGRWGPAGTDQLGLLLMAVSIISYSYYIH